MIKVKKEQTDRICQGDIFRDVELIEYVTEESGLLEVSKIVFPLVIVLTQDCDLEQDHNSRWSDSPPANQDKWLISVLVAPLYNAAHVFNGEHLSDLEVEMQRIKKSSTHASFFRSNQLARYHYLEFPDDIQIVEQAVIDFKHYFSVHVAYLKQVKETKFVCTISDLFREDISQRFANFLSRIGLPT